MLRKNHLSSVKSVKSVQSAFYFIPGLANGHFLQNEIFYRIVMPECHVQLPLNL